MSSWRECKLGDILEEVIDNRGRNPEEYTDFGIPVIDNFMIKNQKYINLAESKRFLDDETFKSFIRKHIQNKDVLITLVGNGYGNISQAPKSKAVIIQNTIGLRCNGEADNDFLFYCLKFNNEEILNFDRGAVQPSIKVGDLKSLEILLPPLEEQKAIAEVLSSLDDKIDLLHRQNQTLESLAQTLFRQWFIEEVKEEWEEKPLKEICEIINGFAFKSGDYRENGRTIIRTMNFKNGFIDNGDVVYIDIQEEIKYTKYQLQKNDFLLVMVGASLGNFAIVTNDILPALQNQNMWNFRTLGNVSQHYLNFAMRQIVEENICSASGSAREFFQKGQFYEFMIKVPDASLMNKFHHNIENFYQKIENNRKQIQTLENLRDTLLPKLLSGEVRVEI